MPLRIHRAAPEQVEPGLLAWPGTHFAGMHVLKWLVTVGRQDGLFDRPCRCYASLRKCCSREVLMLAQLRVVAACRAPQQSVCFGHWRGHTARYHRLVVCAAAKRSNRCIAGRVAFKDAPRRRDQSFRAKASMADPHCRVREPWRRGSHPVSTPSTVTRRRTPARTKVHKWANSEMSAVSIRSSSAMTRSQRDVLMWLKSKLYAGLRSRRSTPLRLVSSRTRAVSQGRPLADAISRQRRSCSSLRRLNEERANKAVRFKCFSDGWVPVAQASCSNTCARPVPEDQVSKCDHAVARKACREAKGTGAHLLDGKGWARPITPEWA